MKAITLLVAISLTACAVPVQNHRADIRGAFSGMTIYRADFMVHGIQDIPDVINRLIDFRSDPDIREPSESVALGYGDCAAYALLWADIAYVSLGKKADICIVDTTSSGDYNHVVVLYDGWQIEPRDGTAVNYEVYEVIPFDVVFPGEP